MLDKIHMSCHEIGLICERKDHKNPSWIERHTKPPPPSLPIVGYWNFHSGPAIVHPYKLNKK